MPDVLDALQGLRPDERARLAAFASAFERVSGGSYPLFTEVAPGDEVRAAQERAIDLVGTGRRRTAVRAAVDTFVDFGTRVYSNRVALPDTFLMHQGLPDRAEDRVRFLATVERAVVGLILWDELDADDRAALIGPWHIFLEGSA